MFEFRQKPSTALRKSRNIRAAFGFSLIELLVVMTLIALLMSIGIVSYRQAGRNTRNGKRKIDLEELRQALVLYRSDQGNYPLGDGGATSVSTLLSDLQPNYMSPSVVEDPKNEGAYIYTYTSDQSTFSICSCLEPGESGGVCDGASIYCLANP